MRVVLLQMDQEGCYEINNHDILLLKCIQIRIYSHSIFTFPDGRLDKLHYSRC